MFGKNTVFIGKLVRENIARRPKQFGLMRGKEPLGENETGVGANNRKPIETVVMCISWGPIKPLVG